MLRYFFLALITFGAVIAEAQDITVKGKITTTGNVLDGFIRFTGSEETPQQFNYSTTINGKFTPVEPASIQKVEYENGEIFEPYEISVSLINQEYLNRRLQQYESELFKGRKFLQKIISGDYSLYNYTDAYGFDHFFYKLKNENSPVQLNNQSFLDENSKFHEDVAYRYQVSALYRSTKCELSLNEMNRISYDKNSLIKSFKKLNECAGSSFNDNYSKQNRTSVFPGVAAGVFLHRHFFGPGSENWENHPIPVLGAHLFLAPGQNRRGFGFSLDAVFAYAKSHSDSVKVGFTTYKADRKSVNLYLRPAGRFYFSGNKIKPFVNTGASISMNLHSDEKYYDSNNNLVSTYNQKGYGVGWLLFAGLGVTWDRFSLSTDYAGILGAKESKHAEILLRVSLKK